MVGQGGGDNQRDDAGTERPRDVSDHAVSVLPARETTDHLPVASIRARSTPVGSAAPADTGTDSAKIERVILALTRSNFFIGRVDYGTAHAKAICRWCGGQFVRYFHHWVCENAACQERCAAHAVLKPIILDDASPFLYLPLPLQVDIEESPVKRLLIEGPMGYGKSYSSRWSLYKLCRQYPGYRALLLRCTYDQLDKNHLQYVDAEVAALGDARFKRGTQEPKHVVFDNGSKIYVGYCEHAIHIPQHKGPEWDRIVFEEGSDFIEQALTTIASRDRGSATAREAMYAAGIMEGQTRIPTNPGGRSALYLRDHYIDKNPDRAKYPEYDPQYYGSISGRIEDNPYLSATFKTAGLGGLDKATYAQMAEGRWDIFPGQFFQQWQPAQHVRRVAVDPTWPLIGGFVFGFNEPGCMLWARVLPNQRLYVEAVWKFSGLPLAEVAREVNARTRTLGADRCKSLVCPEGLGEDAEGLVDAPARVLAREGLPMGLMTLSSSYPWQRVQDYLRPGPDGEPWLLVSPDCEALTRTIPTLRQDDHHPDDLDKQQDDAPARALQVLIASRPSPQLMTPAKQPFAENTFGYWKQKLEPVTTGRFARHRATM